MRNSFIPYLTLNDYLTVIRSGQLNNQLLDYIDEGGEFERQQAESFAIDELRSLLGSHFYLDFELRPLLPFNYNTKYFIGDRVILDFPEWVASSGSEIEGDDSAVSYSKGDCVIYPNADCIAYVCVNPNADTKFIAANWLSLGKQYDIYYVNNPYPFFKLIPDEKFGGDIQEGVYIANYSRVVWYKRMYYCIQDTLIASHQEQENLGFNPWPNIFPNQVFPNGAKNRQWEDKGEFTFTGNAGNLPFRVLSEIDNGCIDAWEPGYRKQWSFGDNRSQVIIQILIAIALWRLGPRNSFMLKERERQRDWAYAKIKKIQFGEATTLIPIIQPEHAGGGILFGGSVKKINGW